jgi:excisionase family DNA binding protein
VGDPSNVNREADVLLWTTSEVAQQLQVSTKTISRLIAQGQLPFIQIGRSIRIQKTDVCAFLESQKQYNWVCVETMCASKGEKPCQSLNVVIEEVKTTTSMSTASLEARLSDLLEPATND